MKNAFLVGTYIYLRPIVKEDLNETYRDWFNDAEVCQFNSHHRFPNYDQNMQEYFTNVIQSRENLILAICDKGNDLHIGNISLQGIDSLNQAAEFAIVIGDKTYWGKGVGEEATHIILDHGFAQLNLHRIYCGTAEDNVGMQNLARKIGFIKEGVSRQALFKNGTFKDLLHFGLLRNEYKTSKKE